MQDHLTRAPLALSPDGSVLAVGTVHGIVELWDLTTGKHRQLQAAAKVFGDLRGPPGTAGYAICSPAFSPDGKTLALLGGWGDGPALCLWDVATGEQQRWIECPPGWSGCLAFAHDGKTVASTICSPQLERVRHNNYPQDRIYLWNVATGKEVRHLDGHKGGARALALSPDGRTLASCGGMDYTVRLWDVVTGLEVHSVGGEQPRLTATPDGKQRYSGECDVLYCMAFSPDGKTLAVGGQLGLRLHEAATGKERYRFADVGCDVTSVAFSADSRVVISGQADSTVLLWDAHAGQKAGPVGKLAPADLQTLWADLAGDDAVRAFRAVGRLAAVPEQAVPFLAERLVAALKADPGRVARLLKDLDSDEFAVRDQASAALALLGKQAEPALRQALESKPSSGGRDPRQGAAAPAGRAGARRRPAVGAAHRRGAGAGRHGGGPAGVGSVHAGTARDGAGSAAGSGTAAAATLSRQRRLNALGTAMVGSSLVAEAATTVAAGVCRGASCTSTCVRFLLFAGQYASLHVVLKAASSAAPPSPAPPGRLSGISPRTVGSKSRRDHALGSDCARVDERRGSPPRLCEPTPRSAFSYRT